MTFFFREDSFFFIRLDDGRRPIHAALVAGFSSTLVS